MFSENALAAMKDFLAGSIDHARYRVGEVTHDAAIVESQVLADGRVSIGFLIDHTVAGDLTVTEVQLVDAANVVWASKTVSITRAAVTEGILYRFRFSITEE